MPARNIVKQFVENGFYHAYNRGVERRRIFEDDQDYRVFLHLLKYYLSAESEKSTAHPLTELTGFNPVRVRPIKNLSKDIELITYCLMPNHFHLLLKQKTPAAMTQLIRKISTIYAMYFNRRYNRVGHLFQGTYRAVRVETDDQLLHLSRYIHLNPSLNPRHLDQYPYSSYPEYIGPKKSDWLNPEPVISAFRKPNQGLSSFSNYKQFVEEYREEEEKSIGKLLIEET